MTKIIEGNLVLEKDTEFDESIEVSGSILGKDGHRFNLKVEGDIDCNNIDCHNITCLDINCRNITCHNITCLDINCLDINCLDIDCLDINCLDIDCHDIDCNDIICNNIDCCGIRYYAVCVAYKNIRCKTIVGRRKNSRHFVLDGKIEIRGDN